MKRRTRDRLRTMMAFVPLAALLVAVVYWMFGSPDHDMHDVERQGINQTLNDYYKRQ